MEKNKKLSSKVGRCRLSLSSVKKKWIEQQLIVDLSEDTSIPYVIGRELIHRSMRFVDIKGNHQQIMRVHCIHRGVTVDWKVGNGMCVTFRRDMTVRELYKWTGKWGKAAREDEKLERGKFLKLTSIKAIISHEKGIWLQTWHYASYAPIDFVLFMVFNATFNNISFISWWSVLLVKETGVPKKTTDRNAASH